LMDAMRIDGAGTLRLLWHLVVPLNRPIIVTLVLITVVTHWNNFMWPMVITSGPEWRVITVATSALQSQYNNNWTLVMAGTTLAMLPLVLLMIAFQKQIIRSVGETTLRWPVAQGPSAGPNPAGELCNAVVIDPLTRNFAELGAGHARAMGTGGIDLCEVGVSSGHNHHIEELASDTPRTSAWGSPAPPAPPAPRSHSPLHAPPAPRSHSPLHAPPAPRSHSPLHALPAPRSHSPLHAPHSPHPASRSPAVHDPTSLLPLPGPGGQNGVATNPASASVPGHSRGRGLPQGDRPC